MSSNDSDTDPDLPHFETVVTKAVVMLDNSGAPFVSYTKCVKETNTNSTKSKSSQILHDLDVIEVLSDGNNSSFSYESFINSVDQANSTEELLNPLTSTRVQLAVHKTQKKKKLPFEMVPKPLNRRNVTAWNRLKIKKFQIIESSSDEDDFNYRLLKDNEKQGNKRPITNQSRHFVVEDWIGYPKNAKRDNDFWAIANSINPIKFNSNPTPNDASETLNSKIVTQLERDLENEEEISTKLKQSFVSRNFTGYTGNFQQNDDYSSLSSLELDSNLAPVDESKQNERKETLNDKTCVTSKLDLEDGERTRSDCNYKTDDEMHSVTEGVDLNATGDGFTATNQPVSQGEKLELLSEGKFKNSEKEICKFQGIQEEDQQDEIFKQAKWQLKEISKSIQINLNMINRPITAKNYKFYKFLLDLEDKLNNDF